MNSAPPICRSVTQAINGAQGLRQSAIQAFAAEVDHGRTSPRTLMRGFRLDKPAPTLALGLKSKKI
jgi:hypothetical protein